MRILIPDLNGSLASFGVRSVLELLAGSGKTGELRLTSGPVIGRALFHDGHIAYATTAPDGDTVRELETLLTRPQSDSGFTIDEVLREQLTEVFHELLQLETGLFDFTESGGEPGSDDQGFLVADVLADVDARIEGWRKIRSVIPSTTEPYRVAAELPIGTKEITVDAPTWRLIAVIGAGGSVEDAAIALDESKFRTAERFASLVQANLLEAVGGRRPVEPTPRDQPADDVDQLDKHVVPPTEAEMPQVRPARPAVTVSKEDLTREEMDEMIRNIGKGIYPTA